MKYFIQYPCYLQCNLLCEYCFNIHDFKSGVEGGPNFTVDEYSLWRDTHLKDREEILVQFHGAEPTMPKNMVLIEDFLANTSEERLDLLTNGLGPSESYDKLVLLKDRIKRIGFTYHRKVITSSNQNKLFLDNILKIKIAGIQVYVKELLFIDLKKEILEEKLFWESIGIPFKIQDFKGTTRGEDFTEFQRYTSEDIDLIDAEYVKTSLTCSCLPGYKQIMIRGGWQAGDILGCWIKPTVVGNIKDNTFNPSYKVELDPSSKTIKVTGVPEIYKGTYKDDRYYTSNEDLTQKPIL